LRAMSFVVAAFVAMACAPADRDIRLERLAAERRSLEATFDHLEERLLVNQARVRFWREMRERHESVSAIACASLDHHAYEMALRAPPAPAALHRARVASAAQMPADSVPAEDERR
jgi:hypothetical protein